MIRWLPQRICWLHTRWTGIRAPDLVVGVEPRQADRTERVQEAGALAQGVVAVVLLRGVLQDAP